MDTDSSLPISAPVLTQSSAPFRLRTRVTSEVSGTAASSTTKRGLRRITLGAAGKGNLTDAKRLQGDKLTEAEAIERAFARKAANGSELVTQGGHPKNLLAVGDTEEDVVTLAVSVD